MLTILRRVKEKSRKLISRYKSTIPFFIIVLFFEVIPIVDMISRSFLSSGMRFMLDNYILIFTKAVYLVAIRNSLFLSFVSSLFGLIISLATALSIPFLSDRHSGFCCVVNGDFSYGKACCCRCCGAHLAGAVCGNFCNRNRLLVLLPGN